MSDVPPPYAVRLTPLAIDDLIALHRWIVDSTDRAIADAYLDRVQARIESLAYHPRRGTPRDDLAIGLRTLAFERRLMIAYRVVGEHVDVLRIISAMRDLAPLMD